MGIINIVVIALIIFWIGGFALHLAGDLIHFILLVIVVILAFKYFKRRPK